MATSITSRMANASKRRILVWCTLLALVFGAIEAGEPLDYTLQTIRDQMRDTQPSGQIVVVGFDEEAADAVGPWPWPRERHALLVDRLFAAGADRVFFDVVFNGAQPDQDEVLARAFARHPGKVFLAANRVPDARGDKFIEVRPTAGLARQAGVVSITKWTNYHNVVDDAPYRFAFGSQWLPSIESILARRSGPRDATFKIDYSVKVNELPYVSAAKILSGGKELDLRGKDVLLGVNQDTVGDIYNIPGQGLRAGVFVVALGAETLIAGKPAALGWLPLLAVAFVAAAATLLARSRLMQAAAAGTGVAAILLIQYGFAEARIGVDSAPALFLTLAVAIWAAVQQNLQAARNKLLVNDMSGLPSIEAFHNTLAGQPSYVVAAHVDNFVSTVSRLSDADTKIYVAAIMDRLRLGAMDAVLHQDQDGTFFWAVPPEHEQHLIDNLAALDAIFKAAIKVSGQLFDVSVVFGIEEQVGLDPVKRVVNARTAIEIGRTNQRLWTVYDPEDVDSATWSLSVIGELDAAMAAGDLWVAYQPKVRLSDRAVIGAEALARWDHPKRGAVPPAEFVAIAERRHRVDRLTAYVVERAVADTARLLRVAPDFTMAINLSPVLLENPRTVPMLTDACARHGVRPRQIVLEITESAPFEDASASIAALHALRELGFGLAIDDYGTGMSNLDYLRRVPASELKIDRSFVTDLAADAARLPLVRSTIELAHSVGMTVVAEGVETAVAAQILASMGCDEAQGFLFGKAMPIDHLLKSIGPLAENVAAAKG